MQSKFETTAQEHQATLEEVANYRARALAFRQRAEEAENALLNMQQVHEATMEQLGDARRRLKKEQDARWSAETEAARLRGLVE